MENNVNKPTRRYLLNSVCAGAASLALPSLCSGQSVTADELIRKAMEAQKVPDYPLEENLLRQAVAMGREDEPVLRALAWALNHQDKHGEAIDLALRNNKLHPGAFSVAGVCETYAIAGEYEFAKKWLRYALQNRSSWGDATLIFTNTLAMVAPTVYRLTLVLRPDALAAAHAVHPDTGTFYCPIPMDGLRYQKTTYQVSGAARFREKRVGDNRWLEITPGKQPITVECDVSLTPMNFSAQIADFDQKELPAEVLPYLASSNGVQVSSPDVVALAANLKGKTRRDTIRNIFLWAHKNIPYVLTKYTLEQSFSQGGGGAQTVLKNRLGHCEGQTSVIVALLRANGIPARFVRCYTGFGGEEGHVMFHTFVEYFVPSTGWVFGEIDNPPFTAPIRNCGATFRYSSPYDAPAGGDKETSELWNFMIVLYPGGPMDINHGTGGNARVRRLRIEENF